ncbi:MAG: hypothetical protein AAGG51_29710 [Cyanobacteria bacterium P01_G01_bin.54]
MNDPLAWLYQELLQSLTQPSVSNPPPDSPLLPETFSDEAIDWDAMVGEIREEQDDARGEAAPMIGGESAQTPQPFAKGDLSTVYKRFEQLIRDRIRDEMQTNLPRFPWEQGLAIEDLNYVDDCNPLLQPAWLPQLQSLLPMQIPEQTLLTLLAACTQVVGSVQPQGIKMADAAKVLFPGYGAKLNEVLNRIRLSPTLALESARDSRGQAEQARARLARVLPASYQQASLEQQMAIAVLLAKSILDRLTVSLTPRQSSQNCTWQSTAGEMHLQVATDSQQPWGQAPLMISATLPEAGQLTLTTPSQTWQYPCDGRGELRVQFTDWEPGQTYLVALGLDADPGNTLQFALACQR